MPSLPAPPAPRLLLGLLLLGSRPAGGTGPEPPALPIRPEKEPLPVRGAAGCSFGGKVYALDETWHPDLGEPFGVMRCVLCACEAPQWARRGRGPGRVSCKNIKPQCPTLACRQPRQLPGHCCQTCPQERSNLDRQPAGLVFEYPRDPEHRSYSDRGEPGAGERTRADGHTDFVALLTGPRSQAVARARVSLQRSSLRFSISYQRLDRPSRVRFTDPTGNILFEHPASPTQDGLVCGVWRAVPRLSLRLLRAEQLHVALVTPTHPSGEVWGPLIWQGALAAETFSAILTLEGPQHRGVGGIALLTLSDTEDSLHFLLLFRGLLGPRNGGLAPVPLKLQILHQGQPLRELQANTSAQEPGFAEVLPSLTDQEMDWLALGELQMALERAGGPELRISGYITARQSCDGEAGWGSALWAHTTERHKHVDVGESSGGFWVWASLLPPVLPPAVLQSVLCGADALIPVQTGAAGSASLILLGNGSLIYQVQVVGTGSEVVAMTLETKPQRKNQRTVLCHVAGLQLGGHMAVGICSGLGARGAHMLLQNELFLNIGTKDFPDGELRGHVTALSYSGHSARYDRSPVPLAGALVLPPVRSQAAGHAWLSLDTHCHLHYEVLLAGLGGSEQGTVTAHLLGPPGMPGPQRLLKGFYGSEAQGVVKDLEPVLLRHLAQGTASLLITTKSSPRGELRGQVHIASQCEVGGLRLASEGVQMSVVPNGEAATSPMLPAGPGSEAPVSVKHGSSGRPRDPNTCFFEGQQRPHGARWSPNYDPLCSLCTCQVGCPGRAQLATGSGARGPAHLPSLGPSLQRRTVICDPIVCPPPSCPHPVQALDQCCPVCPEKQRSRDLPGLPNLEPGEGCYFDGDRSWRAAGTRWHPVVPPFGLIKCAVCTCKGATGEVHCEKVQCPRLACAQPVRANPTDCCKQCPVGSGAHAKLGDPMQADGPRGCRFAGQWFPENQSWHPSVPPFGEMSCITCRCGAGVPHCERDDCSLSLSCGSGKESRCCSHCTAQRSSETRTLPELEKEAESS
ncbi:chordin isoform X2 [Peromyscus californicus insignis]|uniref:chordin isoform X2 n=1 Tax=Peromyscus californicus insignis TaxID=564181 RepID=UPI0022A7A1A4|nr:chordin isoform X2 [Peromyscus californicus insignis]